MPIGPRNVRFITRRFRDCREGPNLVPEGASELPRPTLSNRRSGAARRRPRQQLASAFPIEVHSFVGHMHFAECLRERVAHQFGPGHLASLNSQQK
jgi:hypothetical protein